MPLKSTFLCVNKAFLIFTRDDNAVVCSGSAV